ncbi:unnamed protein product [Rotaria sp. Silwood2]|nr:unnamed protein product [Rotaria sp. Silwood2]CAF2643171.1 unnamed protein product [Rotaria sp. Silwood2]CAF3126473.1 unnamed protein product [Rotaria sp. Silwood2]CAF3358054.1 unnamed protein product [Rotaria sp. Silwood2]CAF4023907.1 unnamed protein product [Rotaria sp. Silwood2]
MQQLKITILSRVTISHVLRQPPNSSTATNNQSSTSSNTSSLTKKSQTKENDETKHHLLYHYNVLCLHKESTYKLLQAVEQMYEVISIHEHHSDNLRKFVVLIRSNLN